MADRNATLSLAVFCDYENVAIGARDAKYDAFDIELVMERLLEKGRVADCGRDDLGVRRANEDGDVLARGHIAQIDERAHSRYLNDRRLVVDRVLQSLCSDRSPVRVAYASKHHRSGRPHVDVFVIISGDSDFSPLVSKLRENDKEVIGIGVKGSSSNLLIDNCDEFIFYDDLVREKRAGARGRGPSGRAKAEKADKARKDEPAPEPTRADKLGDVQDAFDLVRNRTCDLRRPALEQQIGR